MSREKKSGGFLDWIGLSNAPDWNASRPLGHLIGLIIIIVTVLGPLLFLASLTAAFAVMLQAIKMGMSSTTTSINLGAGALIGALLSAPFVLWATVLKYQTVRYQKEGHITDRINKAVEQLGAVKSVETIGRPVTIWTGAPSRISYPSDTASTFVGKPRTKVFPKEWEQHFDNETSDVEEGYYQSVWIWPEERTVIQWQGDQLNLEKNEAVGVEENWQVFKVTEPNIEVRTGAILSLERIAQDSTLYDSGRDHVLVMETLCAYIKENAPIRDTTARPLKITSQGELNDARKWVENSVKPRSDIKIALNVIGRRSDEQIEIERSHKVRDNHYKLDLSSVDIRRAELAGLNFSGAFLRGSWLDGSHLNGTNLQKSNLLDCGFIYVKAANASFQGANFGADFSGAILDQSEFEFHETDEAEALSKGHNGRHSNFYGAQLTDAKMVFSGNPRVNKRWAIGANFTDAKMNGCLFDGYSDMFDHSWPQRFHRRDLDQKGLAFRNCQLTPNIESRCTLEHCFADGSVLLSNGSDPDSDLWPEHWSKDKLSDTNFMRQLEDWRRDK